MSKLLLDILAICGMVSAVLVTVFFVAIVVCVIIKLFKEII